MSTSKSLPRRSFLGMLAGLPFVSAVPIFGRKPRQADPEPSEFKPSYLFTSGGINYVLNSDGTLSCYKHGVEIMRSCEPFPAS